MSYSNPNTFLEHSGLFLNEVEITSIFCEGCDEWLDMNTAIKTYPSGNSVLLFDSCGCVRINNRHHLETKGSLLIKKSSMYDEDYESEDEDSDDEEDDDDEDSDDDDEEDSFSKAIREKEEKQEKIKASWCVISLEQMPDDITTLIKQFVAPNYAVLNRRGWVASIIDKIPRLLKTLNLGKMNKWNNRVLEEGEKPFKETKKLIEGNMCVHLRDYDYPQIFELYERLMVFQSNSTDYWKLHLHYLHKSDYWKDVCEKARAKAVAKLLKKYGN